MRWPFRRRAIQATRRQEPADPTRPELASSNSNGGREAWRHFPPLKRSWPEIDFTIAIEGWGESLVTQQDVPLSIGPLGHYRSNDGPQGTITGIATPLTTPSPGIVALDDAALEAEFVRFHRDQEESAPRPINLQASTEPLSTDSKIEPWAPMLPPRKIPVAPASRAPAVTEAFSAEPPVAKKSPNGVVTPASGTEPAIQPVQQPQFKTVRRRSGLGPPLPRAPETVAELPPEEVASLPLVKVPQAKDSTDPEDEFVQSERRISVEKLPLARPMTSQPSPADDSKTWIKRSHQIEPTTARRAEQIKPTSTRPEQIVTPITGVKPIVPKSNQPRSEDRKTTIVTDASMVRFSSPAESVPEVFRRNELKDDEPPTKLETPPPEVRSIVEALTAQDLSEVPVHRGDSSAEEARRIEAKAFTREGEVHLPDNYGALNQEPASSLLAHELIHVSQQRHLPEAPAEDSNFGRANESQARSIENRFRRSLSPTRFSHESPTRASLEPPKRLSYEPPTRSVHEQAVVKKAGQKGARQQQTTRSQPPRSASGAQRAPIEMPSPSDAMQQITDETAESVEGAAEEISEGVSPVNMPSEPKSGPGSSSAGAGSDLSEGQAKEFASKLFPHIRKLLRNDFLTEAERRGELMGS